MDYWFRSSQYQKNKFNQVKKTIGIFVLLFSVFISCNSNKEQIKIARDEVKTWGNLSERDLQDYEFKCRKLSDVKAYDFIQQYNVKHSKEYEIYSDIAIEYRKEASKYQDLLEKAEGKLVFHKIEYYQIEKDTIHSGLFILNDKDEFIFKEAFR